MTEIVKTVQKKQYVADDGSVFNDVEACKLHEESMNRQKIIDRFEKLPYFRHTPEFVESDYTWKWHLVSSEDDLSVVKEYYEIYEDSFSLEFKPDSYPAWIAVSECDFDGSGQIEGTVTDIIERLHKYENDLVEMIAKKAKEI